MFVVVVVVVAKSGPELSFTVFLIHQARFKPAEAVLMSNTCGPLHEDG
jgi:hypothetical protein